jgi:hypothetical protein
MIFRFKENKMYGNQLFMIEGHHPADPSMSLVKLKCTTDESIVLERYVKLDELELVSQ